MEVDADTRELVARALLEDLGDGDVTAAAVVPEEADTRATITQKAPGVLFGIDVAAEVFRQAGAGGLEPVAAEAEWRDEIPTEVATVAGRARPLLGAERTALNLLGHLSGVATLTALFVRQIEGSGARILDTRKTTPGLRALEKAAVAAGGGTNHRMGLYDAVMIKENHSAAAGGLAAATRKAVAEAPDGVEVCVECETPEDVDVAIEAGARRLLLDNMTPAELVECVARAGGVATLEASGGVTLENFREIADTGVDFVSVGALTHSAQALDLILLFD